MNHFDSNLVKISKYEQLNPDIWFPHIWFFFRTMAHSFPNNPTSITKRKYYDCIQNMPLFLPHNECSNLFLHLLDVYPVSPYLNNKDDFMLWIHFMENMVNKQIGKIEYTQIQHKEQYYNEFKPPKLIHFKKIGLKKSHIITVLMVVLFLGILYLL